MKFALINGDKVEATKGASGYCPSCGSELIAKCGELKINHWAHKGSRNCDPWWENETEWHRSWKNNFPKEWQEVTHFDDESGEKHIADVKTNSGWVLEFQHSPLKSLERLSRNTFYPKLVWIVDGTKRQRDKPKFQRILEEYRIRSPDSRFIGIIGPDDCRLLKEWQDRKALVFFDFQDVDNPHQSNLWFLFPKISPGTAYLWPIARDRFIELHINNNFDELVEKTISPFCDHLLKIIQTEDELKESRNREISERFNLINYGKRRL